MTYADIVREALRPMADGANEAREKDAALAALDALVAERDEFGSDRLSLQQQISELVRTARSEQIRADAAEAAQSRVEAVACRWEGKWQAAEAELKAWKVRSVEWEKRARAAEEKRCDFAHDLEVARLRASFGVRGPDDPAGCPAGHGDQCCGWHGACSAALTPSATGGDS